MRLTPAEMVTRFGDLFERSAFRLETLPFYASEAEAAPLAQWRRGSDVELAFTRRWRDRVAGFREAGKTITRVHVVEEPLSDYLQFELSVIYPCNVDAGEDIRIMPVEAAAVFGPDYWLMDDTVYVLDYDDHGTWLGARVIADPGEVSRFSQHRDSLLQRSIPLADYLGHESRRTA